LPALGLMLLVGLAMHAVLRVPVVWIEGEDAWDKATTVAVFAGAGIGVLVVLTFFPEAHLLVKLAVMFASGVALGFVVNAFEEIWWRLRRD
jgi:hypothetical protein